MEAVFSEENIKGLILPLQFYTVGCIYTCAEECLSVKWRVVIRAEINSTDLAIAVSNISALVFFCLSAFDTWVITQHIKQDILNSQALLKMWHFALSSAKEQHSEMHSRGNWNLGYCFSGKGSNLQIRRWMECFFPFLFLLKWIWG